MEVISKAGLENIKNHKYVGSDYTPLDYLMYRYVWDPCLSLIPLSVAPNLLTFLGFVIVMSTFACVGYYCPTLTEDAPSWVWWYCYFGWWTYITLDALDGRQARRTGSSTPLGQMFDHGSDSINAVAVVYACLAACKAGDASHFDQSILTLAVVLLAGMFFLGQWVEMHTGVLPTRVGKVGVTELEAMACMFPLVCAIFGQDWLKTYIVPGTGGLSLGYSMIVFLAAALLVCGVPLVVRVLCVTTQRREALFQFGVMLAVSVLSYLSWDAWHLAHVQPLIKFLACNLTMCYLSCFIIVCRMSHIPFRLNVILRPLIRLALFHGLCYCGARISEYHAFGYSTSPLFVPEVPVSQHFVSWIGLAVIIMELVLFLSATVSQIADYLKIDVFRIKPVLAKNR